MTDDIVARLRGTGGAAMHSTLDRVDAADEIERLRAELAAEREAQRAGMRALGAAEDFNKELIAERDALRALLREAREELDEIAETNDVMMLKRKKLRELLRGVVARIDAALKGDGE